MPGSKNQMEQAQREKRHAMGGRIFRSTAKRADAKPAYRGVCLPAADRDLYRRPPPIPAHPNAALHRPPPLQPRDAARRTFPATLTTEDVIP